MAATIFETLPNLRLMSFPNMYDDIFVVDERDEIDYHYETARLESFRNWPVPYMEPSRLAAAGFYFTGEADIVKCFECRIEIYKWLKGDDPMADHKRESPNCRFICRTPCGNVPVDVDSDIVTSQMEDRDVCGHDVDDDFPSEYNHSVLTNFQSSKAKYPEYESYDARFRTFESWPNIMPPTKEQLSVAGFYYTGRGDQVLCHYCGVGVKDWDPHDDPWEQHAIWFSNCNYLLMVKGGEFVRKITGQSFSKDMTSYVTKAEEMVSAESKQKVEDDCYPGPSSQSSQSSQYSHDSDVESISSTNSSGKDSTENLSDTEAGSSRPINESRICKICFTAEICKLFFPCGHLIACTECAKYIKTCPICRALITRTIHIYFS